MTNSVCDITHPLPRKDKLRSNKFANLRAAKARKPRTQAARELDEEIRWMKWPKQTTGSIAARENREAMQKMNTETPRTKKMEFYSDTGGWVVGSNFARQLERELLTVESQFREANRQIVQLEGEIVELSKDKETLSNALNYAKEDCNAWRKVADELAGCLETFKRTKFFDDDTDGQALAAYEKLKGATHD